jgi:hypothetical protein
MKMKVYNLSLQVDDVVAQVFEGSSSPEEALKLVGLRTSLSPLASVCFSIFCGLGTECYKVFE